MPSSKKSLPGEGGKYFSLEISGEEVRQWQLFGSSWPSVDGLLHWSGTQEVVVPESIKTTGKKPQYLSFCSINVNEFLFSTATKVLSSVASMLLSIVL